MSEVTRLVCLIRWAYMVQPVVHIIQKLVRQRAKAMRALQGTYAPFFLPEKKMVGGNVFVNACRKSISVEIKNVLLQIMWITQRQIIPPVSRRVQLIVQTQGCQEAIALALIYIGNSAQHSHHVAEHNMQGLFKRTIISICIANFCALNFYMILLVYSDPNFSFKSTSHQISGYLEMAVIFFTFGLLIAMFFSVIIGWPLYWLANKFKVKNIFSSSFVGIAVAIIPLAVLKYFGFNLPNTFTRVGLITVATLGTCGAIGGITFWLLSLTENSSKAVSRNL